MFVQSTRLLLKTMTPDPNCVAALAIHHSQYSVFTWKLLQDVILQTCIAHLHPSFAKLKTLVSQALPSRALWARLSPSPVQQLAFFSSAISSKLCRLCDHLTTWIQNWKFLCPMKLVPYFALFMKIYFKLQILTSEIKYSSNHTVFGGDFPKQNKHWLQGIINRIKLAVTALLSN